MDRARLAKSRFSIGSNGGREVSADQELRLQQLVANEAELKAENLQLKAENEALIARLTEQLSEARSALATRDAELEAARRAREQHASAPGAHQGLERSNEPAAVKDEKESEDDDEDDDDMPSAKPKRRSNKQFKSAEFVESESDE